MSQYTKHTLMLLSKMYRSVLMKCALANAIIFLGAISVANALEPTNGDLSAVSFNDTAEEKISYYDTTTKTIKEVGVTANDEVSGKYTLTDGTSVNILGKQYSVTAASGVISNPTVNEDGSLRGVTSAADYSKSMLFSGKDIAASSTGIIFGTDGVSGSYGDFSVDFIGNNKNYSGASVANSLIRIGNLATDILINHLLTAKFLGNTILASDTSNVSGAMIHDDTSYTMTIEGDFVSNNIEASGDILGGMLYITAGGDKTITGDFIANSVKSSNNSIYGGLIRRRGSTDPQALNINGIYANNTVEGKNIEGGLINDVAPSEIAIKDSVFSGNKIISSTDSSSKGGLIYKKAGKMNITDSQFINNHFSGNVTGGVLALEDSDSTVTIKNSQFVNNKGASSGGVLSTNGTTIAEINVENSLFEGNEASDGNSGAFDVKANKITLTNADFVGNKASGTGKGGAIYSSQNGAEINITGGSFKNNEANSGSAIYLVSGAKLTVDGTTFEGNKGNIYGAVADQGYNQKDVVIKNTTFTDNTAEMGSAIYRNGWNKQGTIAIENTDFTGNESNEYAVYLSDLAEAKLTDLTFDGNKSTANKSSDLYVDKVGKLTITAQNEDFTVKNSTYGEYSNAVTLDADDIVMNAKTGKKIDIQGRAFVGDSGTLNIGTLSETGNDGEVVFDELKNNSASLKLAMNEGTLKLGAKTFDNPTRRLSIASLSLNGGALDLRNGTAGDILLTKGLNGSGTTQLSVDYDPTISGIYNMDGVMLASDATVSGTPVLQLSAINVLADAPDTGSAFSDQARYLWSQNNDDLIDDEHNGAAIAGVGTNSIGTIINASTGAYTYVFTETDKGLLSVTRTVGFSLPEMISLTGMAAGKTNTNYSLTDDLKAGVALGTLANEAVSGTRDATIFLNGYTLNGMDNAGTTKLAGITTQNGQKLTIDGSRNEGRFSVMSGFTTALTNANGAELLVKDTSFIGNDVDIQNDGTLTLEGTGSFGNGVVGTGHTILNTDVEAGAGAGRGFFVKSIEQDKLTVNDGKILTANADNLKTNTIENNGTIKLAAGTLDSAITGGDINIEGIVAINKDVVGTINVNEGTLTANAADYIKGDVVNNAVVSLKDGTLSKTITGGQIKIDGDVKADAALTGDILVSTGKKLTAAADNIKSDVVNSGEVDLTGGELAQNIINGDLTVSGNVSTDADKLLANNITTNGVLTLTGGTLNKALTAGSGSLIVADNARVDINSEVMALTNNGTINAMSDKFTDTVTNNGNLNLIGTTLAADIIGDNGKVRIDDGLLTVSSAAGKKIKQDTITISGMAGLVAEDATLIGESANIVAEGTLTLKNGTLASSKVSGYGTMEVAGDVTANNTVDVAKLEVKADNTLTIDADNLKSSSITNDGTISLGNGTMSATIANGKVNVKSGSTVNASLGQLGTTLTNNGTLNMTGDLTKDIQGAGKTVLGSDVVKVDGNKEIAGTLDMNGKTINMQEDPAQYNELKVGKLAGEGNLNIDADLTSSESDKITVAEDSTGAVLNLNNIKVAGTQANGTHNDHLTYASGAGIDSVDMKINGKDKADADAKLVIGDGSKQYTLTAGSTNGKLNLAVEDNHATLTDYVTGSDTATGIGIFQVSANNDLTDLIKTDGSLTDKKINVINGSAIKGNGNSGIQVADGYKLSLDGKDTGSAANGKMSAFDTALLVEENGELNIKDMTFTNNRIDVEGSGNINLAGQNEFNSGIAADGNVTVADGLSDFVNDAKLNVSSSVTVNNGAELAIAKADNLTAGTLTNDGTLTLKGGKLSQDVSGTGTLNITGNTELANGKTVDQNETIIANGKTLTNNGELTTATNIASNSAIKGNGTLNVAYGTTFNRGTIEQGKINVSENKTLWNAGGTLIATEGVNNSGTVVMNGGVNKADIYGSGEIVVSDYETRNEGNLRQNININSGSGKLTTNADKIQGNVTNNGTVKLTGGTLAKDITNGTTEIVGDVFADAGLGSTKILENGKLTANADNLTAGVNIADAANLDLIGGTLSQDITGVNGITNIIGAVKTTKNINNNVNVAVNGSLDIGSNEITLKSARVDGAIKMKIDDLSAGSDAYTGGKLKVTDRLELNNATSKLQLTIDADKLGKKEKTGELQLIEAGSSDGEFAQTIANNRYTIKSAGNGKYTVEYTQDAKETVVAAGGNANNANTAEAWDNVNGLSGAAEQVRQALNDLSQNDAQGYLKALKAVAPTDSNKNVRVVREVNDLIGNEIARRQEMQGRNGGDALKATGGWLEVLGNYAKQDSSSATSGFTGKTAGFALGLDGKVNEDTTVGFGYAFARTSVDADSGDTDVNGHTLFVYGKYQPSQVYVRGAASYGFADYKEKFNVVGIAAKADYNSDNIGLQAFTGYDLDYGFTPEAGFRYMRQKQDGYTDSLGQHVKTNDVDLLTAVASVKYTKDYALDKAVITPKARLGLTYDVVSDSNTANVNISNVTYRIDGERLERLSAEIGLGLEANVDNLSFSLGYDLGIRKDYKSHTGTLKLKYEF